MKILITSGGTKVSIDRVRSITNMSRGTFGSKIADAFFVESLNRQSQGDPIEKITFFMAKDSRMPNAEGLHNELYDDNSKIIEYVEYSTFDDYKLGIEKLLGNETYDIIVVAAAVSDYGVANYYDGKYRSCEDDMCIKLVKLPKILPIMRKMAPKAVICGFKLLVDSTEDELLNAMEKQIDETNVDLVVGNDLRDIKADDHKLLVMRNEHINSNESVYAYHKYKQPPKVERTPKAANCLAEAVVNECLNMLKMKNGEAL